MSISRIWSWLQAEGFTTYFEDRKRERALKYVYARQQAVNELQTTMDRAVRKATREVLDEYHNAFDDNVKAARGLLREMLSEYELRFIVNLDNRGDTTESEHILLSIIDKLVGLRDDQERALWKKYNDTYYAPPPDLDDADEEMSQAAQIADGDMRGVWEHQHRTAAEIPSAKTEPYVFRDCPECGAPCGNTGTPLPLSVYVHRLGCSFWSVPDESEEI